MKTSLYLLLSFLLTQAYAQDVLSNSSIVAMNDAKVARSLINQKISTSTCNFDVSTPGLIALHAAKVPEGVIETMLARSTSRETMINDDVIRMNEAGLSRRLITRKIQSTPSRFDLTTDGLIRLRTAKVPDSLVKSMLAAHGSDAGAPPPTPVRGGRKTSATTVSSSDRSAVASSAPNRPVAAGRNCDSWFDKFTKKEVRANRVTLRGWKPGASALNSAMGTGAANAFGIEDMEVKLIFRRDGAALTLVLYASKPGIHTMFVSSDKPLMLLLQDDSVLNFMPAESSESDYSWGGGYSMESDMLMYYHLRPDQVRTLSTKLIKAYRLNFYNRKYVQDNVPEGRAIQVREGAACVL